MKFILALTIAALAVAGCGQKNQDRSASPSQPPASNSVSADTKANLEAALQALPGNDSQTSEIVARLNTNGNPSDMSQPANIDAAAVRVAALQKAISVEQEAYAKAIREKDNKVHFPADFLDTFVWGYAGYGLITNANARRALAKEGTATGSVEKVEGAAAEGAAEQAVTTTTTNSIASLAKSELGTGAGVFRTVELATGVVVAAYATGKAIRTWNNDVVVYFTNTEEIKAHKRNIDRAKRDLDAAQADLTALAANQVASVQ